MQKARYEDRDDLKSLIQNVNLIFSTPNLLCNYLKDTASGHLSIAIFTLIIIDECHHAHRKSVYNELMSYYRLAKYGEGIDCLPQIVGLKALPAIHKVKDLTSAKDHLNQIMANLAVSKLSVVKQNKEELLQYTSIPQKVVLSPTPRLHDPLKNLLLEAMAYVESKMNSGIVLEFLTENQHDTCDLKKAISIPLLYAECLEINSLLGSDEVHEILMQVYADKSFTDQYSNIHEIKEIVSKLRDVVAEIQEITRNVDCKADIQVIIENIEGEYQRLKEDSRFFILVKTRAAATALAMRLPGYLRSTYLTGLQTSLDEHDEGGTVVKNEGRDVMVSNLTNIGTDKKNIQQHYLLIKAIEEISKGNNTRDIFIAERQIYEIEEKERMVTKNRKEKVCFSVHCKVCGVVITDGNLMRHVNREWYIVCDKIVLKNVEKGVQYLIRNRKKLMVCGRLVKHMAGSVDISGVP
ncbi:DDX58 [Mytilus edulis]|uniref:DDX58 n=1 Tax=Mytilus edulis TaxID=6550 RepID=A0A8S3UB06_MYTED|nr:DDX58 [Mytilus edulis]